MLVDEENEHTSGPGFSQQPVSEAYKPGKSWLSALETTLHTLADWNGGLLDIAYYETTISSPLVLKALNSHASLATNTLYTLLIFVVAALPDYILAIFTIDRLGRKLIQCRGFALMTLAYGLIAFAPALSTLSLPFLLVYGVS